MYMRRNIRIKICCISSREEVEMAVAAGASALGLVAQMPSGPGVIADEVIADLTRHIPPGVASFLLSSETRGEQIVEQQKRLRASTLQLVDMPEEGAYDIIRQQLPGIKIVQVIHVLTEADIRLAIECARQADALLLDSGNPNAAVKELGGTGRVHNWDISREIVEQAGVPVFLAGGLNAGNVVEALQKVRPFGVDICSGVRSGGRLDTDKLHTFVRAVRSF
jgi:phosphoribosylanthranilate isomerase